MGELYDGEPIVAGGTRQLHDRLAMLSDDIRVLAIADTEDNEGMMRRALVNIIKESLTIANLGYVIQEHVESGVGE